MGSDRTLALHGLGKKGKLGHSRDSHAGIGENGGKQQRRKLSSLFTASLILSLQLCCVVSASQSMCKRRPAFVTLRRRLIHRAKSAASHSVAVKTSTALFHEFASQTNTKRAPGGKRLQFRTLTSHTSSASKRNAGKAGQSPAFPAVPASRIPL